MHISKSIVIASALTLVTLTGVRVQAQDQRAAAEQAAVEARQLQSTQKPEDLRLAVTKLKTAVPIWRDLGDKTKEATTLKSIGVLYQTLQDNDLAADYLNQALNLANAIGNKEIVSESLLSLGQVYIVLGDPRRSLESSKSALPMTRDAGNQKLEAIALVSIGYAYDELGDPQNALDYYKQSIVKLHEQNDKDGEASVSINVGTTYLSLGDHQRALDYYLSALPIIREVKNVRTEATLVNNIGAAYQRAGDKHKALDFYLQGIALHRALEDRYGEAISIGNVAGVYDELGDQTRALKLLNDALVIQREMRSRTSIGTTLSNIGRAYTALGDHNKAFDYYTQSLAMRRETGDIFGESKVLFNLARTEQKRGNLQPARDLVDGAIRIVESVRASLASADLRASYFAASQDYYKLKIDLLMAQHAVDPGKGFDVLALETSENARARGLLDILAEARADLRKGADKTMVESERAIRQQLSARDDARRRTRDPKQAEVLDKEIEALAAGYQDLQADIRRKNPRYAALAQPQPASVGEIQKLLDDETLLLEFSLGDRQSYLWVVSNNAVKSFLLPKRAEIETSARGLYESIKKPGSVPETQRAAAELGKMLFERAAGGMANKRLAIVADGVLGYIPFAALPLGAGLPLIVEHELIYLPSASALGSLRNDSGGRKLPPKTIAVLADPVFDASDLRVGRPAAAPADAVDQTLAKATRDAGFSGRLPRLPGTRHEAATILSFVSENEKKRAVDFEASLATVSDPGLAEHRIIHFATHGLLNSTHPELSGIVLSLVDKNGKAQDGFLRLGEIYDLKLPVELVVLSACQTALGKEIRGEGLIGLTRGFMYAGARRVVATQWAVDDEATSELMRYFYKAMLTDKKVRPAAALREAQLLMLRSKKFSAPYYWSAFAMQGDWR